MHKYEICMFAFIHLCRPVARKCHNNLEIERNSSFFHLTVTAEFKHIHAGA